MAMMRPAATMVSAGMSFTMVVFTVMVALYIGVIYQVTLQQNFHCLIRITRNATI